MHDNSLIITLAVSFTSALVFGLISKRMGLSPIVGYLLAGILVGPHTPGFVGNVALASQLAEIGVIFLMFGVGLHFHVQELMAVRTIAIPGALLQSVGATVASMALAMACGWSWSESMVLGIAISVASTVVLLRVLMDHGELETTSGHVAVGWLIVEDLITVFVLIMLPAFAAKQSGGGGLLAAAGLAVIKLLILGAIVAVAGVRFVPWLLLRVARLRSRELFTLAVLVMSIAVATAAYYVFGASMALGAFLAGMMVGQSKFSHQAGADVLPLRDAFAVLFFVSVGMLFDFHALIRSPLLIVGALVIILAVKPLIAFTIVIVSGRSSRTALTVAAGLAQIGEFSFILAELAKSLGLMRGEGHDVLVAAAIVSISLNPFIFRALLRLEPLIERSKRWQWWHNKRTEARSHHGPHAPIAPASSDKRQAIVVGHGPVGQTMTRLLRDFDVATVIIEMNIDTVSELRANGQNSIYGDATHRDILAEAGIKHAAYLVLTLPDSATRSAIIRVAREMNPAVAIFTRARYLVERDALEQSGVRNVCFDEAEIAAGLARTLLLHMGIEKNNIEQEIPAIRAAWNGAIDGGI